MAVAPPLLVGLPLSLGPPLLVGLPLSLGPPLSLGLPLSVGLPDPVLVVAVGDTLWLPVGLGDLDRDALGDVPRLTPAGTGPTVLPGCVPLADELGECVGDDVGEIVMLRPMLAVGP